MKFQILSEGFVSQRSPGTPTSLAAGSRCVQTHDGELICTFVAQAVTGGNDFKPMISRSKDGGLTWAEQGFIWPHLHERFSSSCAISRAPNGDLYAYGKRTLIDRPGDSAWSDATQGLKQNELYWARSTVDGKSWGEPRIIPMPIPARTANLSATTLFARNTGKRGACPSRPAVSSQPMVEI